MRETVPPLVSFPTHSVSYFETRCTWNISQQGGMLISMAWAWVLTSVPCVHVLIFACYLISLALIFIIEKWRWYLPHLLHWAVDVLWKVYYGQITGRKHRLHGFLCTATSLIVAQVAHCQNILSSLFWLVLSQEPSYVHKDLFLTRSQAHECRMWNMSWPKPSLFQLDTHLKKANLKKKENTHSP